ncbi:uncharacterized protein KY384_007312 [Bacidia gigantensis]|uniref:uncharacterized protein n=1 Tax=Bacidia gigantensis TaxID=2732470 RepID=UPI001D046191|nr:uncharacterized protein KY384_007312 [Bacidia gigantensis]KAG8528394.1 hypothetical protein KY384_007312 [Bacidia gigantensis]
MTPRKFTSYMEVLWLEDPLHEGHKAKPACAALVSVGNGLVNCWRFGWTKWLVLYSIQSKLWVDYKIVCVAITNAVHASESTAHMVANAGASVV